MKNLKRYFFYFVASWCVMCLFIRCYMNMAGLQTGRTLGAGKKEIGVSYYQNRNVPVFTIFPSDNGDDSYEFFDKAPAIEIDSKFGITDKFDLGITLSTARFGMNGKYNFYNDEELFSLAGGLGLGFALGGEYIQPQLFASVHPTDRLAFYANPSYSLTFLNDYSYSTLYTDNLDFFGANLGFLYGERIQVGADIGFFRIAADRDIYNTMNFSIGAKFRFGH